MSPAAADPRVAAAEEILRSEGISGGRVRVEGRDGEVAVVRTPEDAWERLLGDSAASVARRVREVGFRYVSLDLEPGGGHE